jgi:hypothetical protein
VTLAQPNPILAGVNGWHRWGGRSAHFFIDGVQLCNTAHGNYLALGVAPQRPEPAELSRHGEPFGRACTRCLKRARARSIGGDRV